jgi:hypothetical protein
VTTPFLVTGCGRSGTGWAAALFTALGYPCGHEVAFHPDVLTSGYPIFEVALAQPESSWLAVPYAHRLREGTPVLRLMRNPYYVVQSAMARGFLDDMEDPFAAFVTRHRPDITFTPDHLGRVIRWVGLWDEPLYDVDHLTVQIETDNVARAVEYATGDRLPDEVVQDALVLVGNSVNTNADPWRAVPSLERILDHPDAVLLAQRARRFGYPN